MTPVFLDNGWQVLSLTELKNAGRGSFGEAYNLVLDGVALRAAFLRGFCSPPTSTFLPLPNVLTKISMYVYVYVCVHIWKHVHIYTSI